jgi:hypothetical protein
MLKEIKGFEKLYRITRATGSHYFVVTDSTEALVRYVVAKEKAGYLISSIAEVQTDGKTPRIAIRSLPEYKAAQKAIMTFKEFQQTDEYKQADVIEAYDKDGYEVQIEWLEVHSYHIVLEHRTESGVLTIVVDAN